MPFALPEVTNHVDRSDHSVGPSSLEDAKVAQPDLKANLVFNLHVDMYVALFVRRGVHVVELLSLDTDTTMEAKRPEPIEYEVYL